MGEPATARAGVNEFDPAAEPTSSADSRRWMRDLGALLALPALWVDHDPVEIAEGLLSVLFGVLPVGAAYARFDDPRGGSALETWRPTGSAAPAHLVDAVDAGDLHSAGLTTAEVRMGDGRVIRVTTLPLTLPWEHARVVVSAAQAGFPSERDAHLLRVAVSQAAIAIHTSRRLAREHAARIEAEAGLEAHRAALSGLVSGLGRDLASLSAHAERAVRTLAGAGADPLTAPWPAAPVPPVPASPLAAPPAPAERAEPARAAPLTRRESEVLGLLAQGLSNKEIAGVMWISDRTIERHVTSLYRKIGVGRRSEATAFALRHGFA